MLRTIKKFFASANNSAAKSSQNKPKIEDQKITPPQPPKKLNHQQFKDMYDNGERDFKNYILDNVDLKQFSLYGVNFENCDFRLMDLRGVSLKCRLEKANFSGMNLERFDFSNCALSQAKFIAANLRGANFVGAVLTKANFSDANLYYAYLMGADLSMANLTNAELAYANFNSADLSYATLDNSNLVWADLSHTNLCFASLLNTNSFDADFYNSNRHNARFDEMYSTHENFVKA